MTSPGQARQEILADYARIETRLQDLITDPGPLVRNGSIVHGQDGRPVPDPKILHKAQKLLKRVQRNQAALLGDGLAP